VSLPTRRILLLSPARLDGVRGRWLRSARSQGATARRLREQGLPIGEAFAFVSGLYFRGKLAYARRFAPQTGEALVIAPGFGLVDLDWRIDPERLRRMHAVGVDLARRAYRQPLALQAAALGAARVVLLGSLATGKYLDVLAPVLGERLHFPRPFLGAGDMRRGALLLRAARTGEELDYAPVSELPLRRGGG
jgi:hypothetical protein